MSYNPAAPAADDRYARRNFTLSPEAVALLESLHDRFGKPYSEIVCLGLQSIEGNNRLLRHALAQPLHSLRLHTNLLLAKHPDDVEIHDAIARAYAQVEAILNPPKLPTSPKR